MKASGIESATQVDHQERGFDLKIHGSEYISKRWRNSFVEFSKWQNLNLTYSNEKGVFPAPRVLRIRFETTKTLGMESATPNWLSTINVWLTSP